MGVPAAVEDNMLLREHQYYELESSDAMNDYGSYNIAPRVNVENDFKISFASITYLSLGLVLFVVVGHFLFKRLKKHLKISKTPIIPMAAFSPPMSHSPVLSEFESPSTPRKFKIENLVDDLHTSIKTFTNQSPPRLHEA